MDSNSMIHVNIPNIPSNTQPSLISRLKSTFVTYLPLSLITFGGPQAHIALFHDLFVSKLCWISDELFIELFSIASSLPGPASTQLAYAICLIKNGTIPAIFSFLIWSVPCMFVMTGLGIGVSQVLGGSSIPSWIEALENGLVSSALGLISLAAYKLGNKILLDSTDKILALISIILAINYTTQPYLFPCLMIFGALVSCVEWWWNRRMTSRGDSGLNLQSPESDSELNEQDIDTNIPPQDVNKPDQDAINISFSRKTGLLVIAAWAILVVISVCVRIYSTSRALNIFGTFYFVGSIIFGGGPVVIPLLQNYMVSYGWLTSPEFLIGLAFAQALPGPMFNFAAFCGALAMRDQFYGIFGAILAYIGIFLPGLLLITGLMPLWKSYRQIEMVKIAFKGINASAVGLVYVAVYLLMINSISGKSGSNLSDFSYYVAIACSSFTMAGFLNVSAPIVVLLGGISGIIMWKVSPW